MVMKLEAGHWYKESSGRTWMYLYDYEVPGEEDAIRNGVMFRGQRAVTLIRPDDLDLTTLVEVCYVDGEEMIVGAEYRVESDPNMNPFVSERSATFHGIVDGKPVFKPLWSCTYVPYQRYTLKKPVSVTTYTLVKTIDGKELDPSSR